MNILWRQAALLIGVIACAPVFAHSKLVSSTPAGDAVVSPPPARLELDFNEAVEIAFTSVALVGPSSQAIKLEAAKEAGGDGSKVVAPLPALTPGVYHVDWATVGRDGHHVKGTFAFTIK